MKQGRRTCLGQATTPATADLGVYSDVFSFSAGGSTYFVQAYCQSWTTSPGDDAIYDNLYVNCTMEGRETWNSYDATDPQYESLVQVVSPAYPLLSYETWAVMGEHVLNGGTGTPSDDVSWDICYALPWVGCTN
jgi:hypothetical protein